MARRAVPLAVACLLVLISVNARADVAYFYDGLPYQVVDDPTVPGMHTAANQISAYFVVSEPLLPNLTTADVTSDVLWFEFDDGRTNIDASSAVNFYGFAVNVSTDASGNITAGAMFADTIDPSCSLGDPLAQFAADSVIGDFACVDVCGAAGPPPGVCSGSSGDLAITNPGGVWTVPEPASGVALLAGCALVALLHRHRARL